jgi:hypothetical protein
LVRERWNRLARYTKIFTTPDELVDFLMLEVEEHDRILAEFAKAGKIGGVEMCCRLETTPTARLMANALQCDLGR